MHHPIALNCLLIQLKLVDVQEYLLHKQLPLRKPGHKRLVERFGFEQKQILQKQKIKLMMNNLFLFDGCFDFDRYPYELVVHVFKQAKDAKELGSHKGWQVDVIADVVEFREALVELKVYVLRVIQTL